MPVDKQYKKRIIIVASYDGISTMFSGVGKVTDLYIDIIRNYIKILNRANEIDFGIAETYIANSNSAFENERLSYVKSKCDLYYAIPTNSDGQFIESHWGIDVWKSASCSLATLITTLSQQYKSVTLLAHDTMFASVRKYLNRARPKNENINIYWIPHSLARIFNDSFSDQVRDSFEVESIQSLIDENDKIVAINSYMRNFLNIQYRIPHEKIYDIHNRIKKTKTNSLTKYENVILIYGRCTHQKGYDYILPIIKEWIHKMNYKVICIAPYGTSPSSYIRQVEDIVRSYNCENIYFEKRFIDNKPIEILSNLNEGAVILPSRYEASPLAPLEALTYLKPSIPIIYSNIPPHNEVLNGRPNCYQFNISENHKVIDYLNESIVNNQNCSERESLNFNEFKNQLKNIIKSL
jgi:glycosyltransferase involved in cell wall biosynthesis